jgi:hypothetical protein
MKIDGKWTWSRTYNPFNYPALGWVSAPTTVGDCAGFSGKANLINIAAVTFPCTEVKRVVCEPL